MHIWTIEKWRTQIPPEEVVSNSKISMYFDKSVDKDLAKACRFFVRWVKKEYYFPLPMRIYFKDTRKLVKMDNTTAVGTFYEPPNFSESSIIRIAVGDYAELLDSIGRDNAIATILVVIAHEMTHYFQWINGLKLTDMGRERQATQYSHYILNEYSDTRDHP